jgi:sugar lactone lactonase YvrE
MPRRLAVRGFVAFAVLALATVAGSSHADTVYVTSFTTGALIRYDSANPAGTATTLSGTGVITFASGLAVGPDGNLYISEAGDGGTVVPKILRLNLSTNALSVVHAFSSFDVVPAALIFNGNDLLVGRNPIYGNTGPIVKMTNVTGGTVAVSNYTTGGGLASSPGLALAADGSLYVSDQTYSFVSGTATGPVKRFDATGIYIDEVIASGSNGLSGPTGLAVSGSTLYTASIMNGSILQTNLTDDVTQPFGSTGVLFGASPLSTLSDGGLLAGTAGGAGDIYHLAANGTVVSTYASGLGTIGGIVTVAVPEPGTLALAVLGIAGFAWHARKRRRNGNG